MIAFAAAFLAAFVIISSEVREANAGQVELIEKLDQEASQILASIRSPKLNAMAVEITSLGSGIVVSIFVLIVSVLFAFRQRYIQILHLLFATIGSAILMFTMKSFFERPRPPLISRLVDVQGYSFPSGHSLTSAAVYLTFAFLLGFHFKKSFERLVIIGLTLIFIFTIAISRVYLGVHYLSDVIAGVFVGLFWAASLAAISQFYLGGQIDKEK